MKERISDLEEKAAGPISLGLGMLCELGASEALKHPEVYDSLQKIQYGTMTMLPSSGIEAAVLLGITGILFMGCGLIAVYNRFKARSNYEKL
jgi:hypothetical protein